MVDSCACGGGCDCSWIREARDVKSDMICACVRRGRVGLVGIFERKSIECLKEFTAECSNH